MIHPVTVLELDADAKTVVRRRGHQGDEIEKYDIDIIQHRSYGLFCKFAVKNKYITHHFSQVLPSLNLLVTHFNWHSEHPLGNYDYYIDIVGEVEQGEEVWTVRDLYLDVLVFEGKRAKVLDTDEYLQAVDAGHFRPGERDLALERTHWLVNGLGEHGYHLDPFLAQQGVYLDWTETC